MFRKYANNARYHLKQGSQAESQIQSYDFVGDLVLCVSLVQDGHRKTERQNGIVKLVMLTEELKVGIGRAVLLLGKNKKDANQSMSLGVRQYLKEITTLAKYVLSEVIGYRPITLKAGLNIQNYEQKYRTVGRYV
jgi:hypothetical protein